MLRGSTEVIVHRTLHAGSAHTASARLYLLNPEPGAWYRWDTDPSHMVHIYTLCKLSCLQETYRQKKPKHVVLACYMLLEGKPLTIQGMSQ